MAYPKAYEPVQDQMYQILTRYGNEAYEHCDYAVDKQEMNHLLSEYKLAYSGQNFTFKVIKLPKKYHPKQN